MRHALPQTKQPAPWQSLKLHLSCALEHARPCAAPGRCPSGGHQSPFGAAKQGEVFRSPGQESWSQLMTRACQSSETSAQRPEGEQDRKETQGPWAKWASEWTAGEPRPMACLWWSRGWQWALQRGFGPRARARVPPHILVNTLTREASVPLPQHLMFGRRPG